MSDILQKIHRLGKPEIFFRLLGVVYFFAFSSLAFQILGLIGSQGILPVHNFLEVVKSEYGRAGYYLVPTAFWVSSSDFSLQLCCGAGIFLSLLLISGFLTFSSLPKCLKPAGLFLLWFFYLSLVTAGQEFMVFQWDSLLLEMGFLSFILAIHFIFTESSTGVVFLFRFLLFRLMFMSGVVKLLSGDPSWRDLTALSYHYETQPLPTWIAWYLHLLPQWIHQVCVAIVFIIETILPFFIFFPWKWRRWAFAGFVVLQVSIIVTGNYGFFNWLTLLLCLTLLPSFKLARQSLKSRFGLRRVSFQSAIGLLVVLGITRIYGQGWGWSAVPYPLRKVLSVSEPFALVNSYGLFAVMTRTRKEIIVEGSDDAKYWVEYSFKWKPVNITQAPQFIAPHQPRLDWLFWFAALSDYSKTPWISAFFYKILQGSQPVLNLLNESSFAAKPPKYLRAMIYEYEFSSLTEKRELGVWWRRKNPRFFSPILSLR